MHHFLVLFVSLALTTCASAVEVGKNSAGAIPALRNDIDDLWAAIGDLQQKNSEQPKLCQGRTNYDQWLPYNGPVGIKVHVDTSRCLFQRQPAYFTSLSGNSHHWTTTGATSIYAESTKGFDVYLYPNHPAESNGHTMANVASREWELNWIGIEKKD